MKKITSYLIIFCMVITSLPFLTMQVNATVSDDGGKWLWPVKATKKVVSGEFAPSNDPDHKAIDIPDTYGTTIRATRAGTVCFVQTDTSMPLGNYVVVKHTNSSDGNTYYSHYAHLSSISVNEGERVNMGTKLGVMGTTGDSTGVHLHFQITRNTSQHYGRTYPNVPLSDSPVVNTNIDSIDYIMNPSWAYSLSVSNKASTGKPYLQWEKRSSAVKYKVYRKRASASSYSLIKTTTNRYYTDTTAVPSNTYMYYIKAISKSGKTLQSTYAVKRACDLAKPTLTKTSNIASTGAIKISFKGVKNANCYQLYRSTSKNGPYEYLAELKCTIDSGGEGHYFVNSNSKPGVTYYYKVRAINTNNSSADSVLSDYKYRTRDLAKPIITEINNIPSTGGIRVCFDGVEGADCYKLYRATSSKGTYNYLAKIDCSIDAGGEKHYFVNNNSTPGKTYYYKIRAVKTSSSAADSALSDYKYRTRDLARPTVTLSYASTGKIKISWSKVAYADKYSVYRSTSENGTYTRIWTSSGTSVINTKNLVEGTTYYYKVIAIDNSNSSANSAYSEVKSLIYPKDSAATAGADRLIAHAKYHLGDKYNTFDDRDDFTTDWCSQFIQHCSAKAGLSSVIPTSGCALVGDMARNVVNEKDGIITFVNKKFYDNKKTQYYDSSKYSYQSNYNPKKGDLIIFSSDAYEYYTHIGIVTANSQDPLNNVKTIEGNTGGSSYTNSYVKECTRSSMEGLYIVAYVTPDYPN